MSIEKKNREIHKRIIGAFMAGKDIEVFDCSEDEGIKKDLEALKECLNELNIGSETGGFLPIINFRNNEIAFRMLIPIMGALGINAFVSGTGELSKTPFDDIIDTMTQKGCEFRFDHFPFELSGTLKSGEYKFEKEASCNFISGLLMALPLVEGNSFVVVDKDYSGSEELLETVKLLEEFGISIAVAGNSFDIKGGQKYIDCM